MVEGRIAYCSQEPWIITGSIRQNILCGAEMDLERYYRVIRATALENDFNQLPMRDLSVIGEGGVSLSGGQKSRINLARCLYVDAEIYLLDDPLSAVDVRVGSHLFEKAIIRFLHGKIRVFVTHQLQHLKDTDDILSLKLGRVEFNGSYLEFKKIGLQITTTEDKYDDSGDEVMGQEPNSLSSKSLPFISEDVDNISENSSGSFRKRSILKYSRRQSRRRSGSSYAGSLKVKFMKEV